MLRMERWLNMFAGRSSRSAGARLWFQNNIRHVDAKIVITQMPMISQCSTNNPE
jgi:hypothetical protein